MIPIGRIDKLILILRGHRVMPDRDLAALYGVPTGALKQPVKRNRERFPEDFMFVLSSAEFAEWRSQIVASKAATVDDAGLRSQTVTSKKDPPGDHPPARSGLGSSPDDFRTR